MKESNLDQEIREKLQGREIQPSASAWERLASQLDTVQEKKKKSWFLYVGYAASILLIVSLFFFFNNEDSNKLPVPENTLVEDNTEKPEIDKTKDFNTTLVESNALVENTNTKVKEKESEKKKPLKSVSTPKFVSPKVESVVAQKDRKVETKTINVPKKIKELVKQEETGVAIVDAKDHKKDSVVSNRIKKSTKGISVDSDALLYSVTHTRDELKSYYKKYKVDRQDVLIAIEKQLKKSRLKIDPKTILAEVERDVNEESFQNNFYQFIKKRVSDVATAIANRNN